MWKESKTKQKDHKIAVPQMLQKKNKEKLSFMTDRGGVSLVSKVTAFANRKELQNV